MAQTEKLSPRTLYITLKGQGLSQLIVLASYLSDLIHKIKCRKKKLAWCLTLIIPDFAGFMEKMFMTKIKLFSVISVNFGFIFNVTNINYLDSISSFILYIYIFKPVMNPGIA